MDGTAQAGYVEVFTGEECRTGRALCDVLGVMHTMSLGEPQRVFVYGPTVPYLLAVLAVIPMRTWSRIMALPPIREKPLAALTAARLLGTSPERWAMAAINAIGDG